MAIHASHQLQYEHSWSSPAEMQTNDTRAIEIQYKDDQNHRDKKTTASRLIFSLLVTWYQNWTTRWYFKTYKEPRNRFQGIDFASLCNPASRYDNPIPTRFLVPIDCSKIPALYCCSRGNVCMSQPVVPTPNYSQGRQSCIMYIYAHRLRPDLEKMDTTFKTYKQEWAKFIITNL